MVATASHSALAAVVLASVVGCESPSPAPAEEATAEKQALPQTESQPEPDELEQAKVYVHSARRCSECHEAYHEQWEGSAHARSSTSPAYQAMRSQENASTCDRCHAPLAELVGQDDLRTREGVSCEVCHGIAKVEKAENAFKWSLELSSGVRYGPLCDAEDHYFHRMGCSPLHETSEICAACHTLTWKSAEGTSLPVLSEYDEWKASPFGSQGVTCQYCHMPTQEAEVAKGAGERADVSAHAFLSDTDDLRLRSLMLEVRAAAAGEDRIAVTLRLTNRAGHSLPSGFQGRRVVVEARVVDAAGETLDAGKVILARTLADSADQEVPFYRATQVLADTRLSSRESRDEQLELSASKGQKLVVEAHWQSMSEALAKQLGVEPEAQTLLTANMQIYKAAKGHRLKPPRVMASPVSGAEE